MHPHNASPEGLMWFMPKACTSSEAREKCRAPGSTPGYTKGKGLSTFSTTLHINSKTNVQLMCFRRHKLEKGQTHTGDKAWSTRENTHPPLLEMAAGDVQWVSQAIATEEQWSVHSKILLQISRPCQNTQMILQVVSPKDANQTDTSSNWQGTFPETLGFLATWLAGEGRVKVMPKQTLRC